MVAEARGIGPVNRPNLPNHPPAVDLSVMRRVDLAHRLLDNRLIGDYLNRAPKFMGKFAPFEGSFHKQDLKVSILDALSFDYALLNPIIDQIFAKVDRLLDQDILARANQQIIEFHQELKSSLPVPDVAGFFKLSTFGGFDPQQYLLVKTLGSSMTIADVVRKKGFQDISLIPQGSLAGFMRCLEEGYTLLRATEIASRQ